MKTGISWLDFKLGLRMLVKHPGLTLVGGFAMAVAVAISAIFFEAITEVLHSELPFDEGERVVAIQYAKKGRIGNAERRILHDFAAWREELASVEELGAFRTVRHTLTSGDGPPEPVPVAAITAEGFRLARTPPLLGRYLLPDDERAGVPPVVVIGHEVWQSRFAGDTEVVGQMIELGGVPHVVVGVMPEGFEFPVRHQLWIPFRADPSDHERLQGPELYVFGRLAPGVTLEQAQAELTTVGQRTAAAHPDTHERLRAVVLPFTREHVMVDHPVIVRMLRIAQLLFSGLLVVIAVNLAILMYARTATRLGEIAVRSALGASRRRILTQLFVEALVLSILGAAAGLALAQVALDWFRPLVASMETIPFWIDLELSVATAAYALGLAILAALIVGVLPGLKATGRRLHANLREQGSASGVRLGRTWMFLIVAQVAVAVTVLPLAVFTVWQVVRTELAGPGFPAGEYLIAVVGMDGKPATSGSAHQDTSELAGRFGDRQLELMSRLAAEPGVSAVAFSVGIPGFEGGGHIELQDEAPAGYAGRFEVNALEVGPGLFDTYDAELLAGREFAASDFDGSANPVIVNRTFVEQLLGGGAPLGRRLHYSPYREPGQPPPAETPESFEIVGVVSDFPAFPPQPGREVTPRVCYPAQPGTMHSATLSIRFEGVAPAGARERVKEIASAVDPALQLRRIQPLLEIYQAMRSLWRFMAWGLALVTVSVLGLSTAGIYALMSFTVAQRTREIGIRAALGAEPRRILPGIFGRAVRQLALGLLIGSLLSAALLSTTEFSLGRSAALLLAVASIMLIVGLLAAWGPARRGLQIQPTEALKAE